MKYPGYARKTSLLVDVTPSNVTFSVIGGLTEPMSPADAALRLRTDGRNPELLRFFDPELPPQFLYYTSKTSFRPKEVFFTIPCFS